MKTVVEAAQRRVIFDKKKKTLRDIEFRNEKNTTHQRVTRHLKENNRRKTRGIQITVFPKKEVMEKEMVKISSVELRSIQKRNTPGPKKNYHRAIITEIQPSNVTGLQTQ